MRQSSLFTGALGIVLALVSPVQGAWRLIWSDEFNGPPNALQILRNGPTISGTITAGGIMSLKPTRIFLRMPTWMGRAIS